jgi:predicted RND superfamily exporter protein
MGVEVEDDVDEGGDGVQKKKPRPAKKAREAAKPSTGNGNGPLKPIAPDDWLTRLFRRIIAWRWPIIALWVLLVIPSAYYATKVDQDNSINRIIAPEDPASVANHAFEQVFGGGEYAVLLLEVDDPTSLEALTRLDRFEQLLAGEKGIEASSALRAYREARAGFTPDAEGAAAFKKFVSGTDAFRKQGMLGDHFLSIALVLDSGNRKRRDELLARIEELIREAKLTEAPFTAVRRVGAPYVNSYFDAATASSGPRYFGLFGVLVVVLVLSLYRSFRTLTLVSPMVPMTILVTATATLVYLHSRFVERPEGVSVEEHHVFALRNKTLACSASIFAAVVGFAALCVSNIRPIRDMGLWVAVGLFICWLIVFTLFPALQRVKTPTGMERRAAAPWFARLANALPLFTYKWRIPLVFGTLALTVAGIVSIFGAGKYIAPMEPLTEAIEYVSRDSTIYQDTRRARELLPGLSVTHVWLKGKGTLVTDPKVLNGLHDFQSALEKDPEVGAVVGLPTLVRMMQYAGGEGDKFPEDEEMLEEASATLEGMMLSGQANLRRFVDRSGAQTQLTVLNKATDHTGYERLKNRIAVHWTEATGKHPELKTLELATVGLGPLQAMMSQELVPTLVESFALTAGIIFITFLLVFRSGAARIMTMLPSLFAILVMFLVMRIVGMNLNIATILIASTVLGTSENDQIHFFYHFLEGRRTGTVSQALVHTFLISGRAIFFATLINATGFLAFAVADMRPMQQFGILTSVALTLAMIADFTALPAALWLIFGERPDSDSGKSPAGELAAGKLPSGKEA